MIYISKPSSTFKFGFYRFICSSICSTLIFKSSFCRATCGVSVSPSTCYTLILGLVSLDFLSNLFVARRVSNLTYFHLLSFVDL
jgi:hypothetical protein